MGGCAQISVVTTSKNQAVIQISCSLVIEGYLTVLDLGTQTFGCGASSACAAMLATFESQIINLGTSGDASKIFVTEGRGTAIGLWDVNADTFTSQSLNGSGFAAADADGTLFANGFGIVDTDLLERSVMQDVDYLFAADASTSNVFNEKLHPSGSLLYVPQDDGVDIFDVHRGRLVLRVALPVQIPVTLDALAIDETGSRLFLISATGLTVVQLAQVPLSIGTVTPNAGPASGGTTLVIRGSGFVNGATVSFGTTQVLATVVDAGTLTSGHAGASGGALPSQRRQSRRHPVQPRRRFYR
jgi:hypothetical protein